MNVWKEIIKLTFIFKIFDVFLWKGKLKHKNLLKYSSSKM